MTRAVLVPKMSLNPLEKVEAPGTPPDKVQKQEQCIDDAVENAVNLYVMLWEESPWKDMPWLYVHGKIVEIARSDELLPILTPVQLDRVIHRLCTHDLFHSNACHTYFEQLLQATYNSGHAEFTFVTYDIPRVDWFYEIKACKEKRAKVHVIGDVGDNFGIRSTFCDYTVDRNAGKLLGEGSQRCTFTVGGDIGLDGAHKSKRSKYLISGSGGDRLGNEAEDCDFTVHGYVHDNALLGASRCHIRTSDPRAYRNIMKWNTEISNISELIGKNVFELIPCKPQQ